MVNYPDTIHNKKKISAIELASGPLDSAVADSEGSRNIFAEMPYSRNSISQADEGSIDLASGPDDSQYDQQSSRRFSLAEIPDIDHTLSFHSAEGGEPKEVPEPSIQLYENKLTIFAALIPMSILGTLIRLGLNLLETYNGSPVFALAYPQFVGCLIMGIAVKKKDVLLKYYLPLQIALSTGLCGSITTFSSWQLGIFEAFSNYAGASHATGYNVSSSLIPSSSQRSFALSTP
jgi:fluoride ion exporter CrcB/FEX